MDKIFKKPLTGRREYGIIQVSQGRWIKDIERRDAFQSVDREEPEQQDRKQRRPGNHPWQNYEKRKGRVRCT